MTAFYNEIDPKAAAWLRELIAGGHIAPGIVDERDIRDIRPDELLGFAQCHFFAGIGGWSLALRRAGWADDRPVWTGSCPCQPFSAAGKRGGTADERHLWPAFFHLIDQCRPPVVFGEQVASKDGLGWFDLVSADLEGSGYAVGASDLCAAGVGAPHIRQRLWFVGVADALRSGAGDGPGEGLGAEAAADGSDRGLQGQRLRSGVEGASGDVDYTGGLGWVGRGPSVESGRTALAATERPGDAGRLAYRDGDGREPGREIRPVQAQPDPQHGCGAGRMADTGCRYQRLREDEPRDRNSVEDAGRRPSSARQPGPTNGHWRDADWLFCRDGKWRPVEPGTFPLAHGVSGRVGLLRGYGNAIVPEVAQAFIEACQNRGSAT